MSNVQCAMSNMCLLQNDVDFPLLIAHCSLLIAHWGRPVQGFNARRFAWGNSPHEPENARVGNERLRQNRFMGPRRVQILEVEAFHEPPGEGEAPAEPTLEHLEKISLPLAVTAGPAGSVARPA